MVIAALATDVTVLGAIHLVARAGAAESPARGPDRTPPTMSEPEARFARPPAPWARCLASKDGQVPTLVALTYLDRGRDAAVTLGELRGWFGKLAPAAVQIWQLELKGASRARRLAFEVPQASWPAWLVPDPTLALEARCDAMHAALRAHGIGRPRPADAAAATDVLTRSRHDVEFLFPRRPEQYTTMIPWGTVADLTEARFAGLLAWIDAPAPEQP